MVPAGHRSYKVELDSGSVLRRNHRHLRRVMDTETTSPRPVDTGETPVPVSTGDTGDHQVVRTRSGRVVQTPRYLSDFVCK